MQLNSYMPTLRRQHVRIQHHSMAGSRCSRISGLSGNKSANQRQKFVRERKDPAKMTNSRRALSRRGLGIRPAGAKSGVWSHSASIDQMCAFIHQAAAFERSNAHLARKPSTRKNSNRKSASTRSGLEPKPCSRAPRAHERVRHPSNIDLRARMFKSLRAKRIDLRTLHYGESKDPAKMAYSRLALIRRGLGAKPTSSNSYAGAHHARCRSASAQAS